MAASGRGWLVALVVALGACDDGGEPPVDVGGAVDGGGDAVFVDAGSDEDAVVDAALDAALDGAPPIPDGAPVADLGADARLADVETPDVETPDMATGDAGADAGGGGLRLTGRVVDVYRTPLRGGRWVLTRSDQGGTARGGRWVLTHQPPPMPAGEAP